MTAVLVGTTVAQRDEILTLIKAVRVYLNRGADIPPWLTDRLATYDYDAVKREMTRTLHEPEGDRDAGAGNSPDGLTGGPFDLSK